ncbi:MAG: aldo/keto reductase [Verrucomicrobia bacterium]|nr:MAG: aldo/keto reductase [Verrucomicrobiota bacterium]
MPSQLTLQSTVRLNDGNAMPVLGLGVFQMDDEQECIRAVQTALDCGYRHIDTAAGYGNEAAVGTAIAQAPFPREAIFITSKVPPDRLGRAATRRCVENSLRHLRTDVIDLYLIHWPRREGTEASHEELQALRNEGKLRSVGVSNFSVRRFEEQFFPRITGIPAVNQFERHPFCANNALVDFCRRHGIQPVGYSPLGRGGSLSHAVIQRIARAHNKTAAQVVIRWQLQHGVVVIPKSANPARIRENADVFDFALGADEMAQIDNLDSNASIIDWLPEHDWF